MSHVINYDHDVKYWDLAELQAAINSAFSELGTARLLPEGTPDRIFAEAYSEEAIERLGSEMRKRIIGGQDLAAACVEARRYPPELIATIKSRYDLRDVIPRGLGITGPISGNICSPFRDDRTPSFTVHPEYFYDFGTGESGDLFDWRMRFHGVSFWQAVESLAIEACIPLPEPSKPERSTSPTTAGRFSLREAVRRG